MRILAACWFTGWVTLAGASVGSYSPAETFGYDLPIYIAVFLAMSMFLGAAAAVEYCNSQKNVKPR